MIPVFEFIADGNVIGCGTQAELDHWTAEGVMIGVTTGDVIAHEPASEDARRAAAWRKAA